MLLGIPDPQIIIGYGLAIGLALVCIAYGWLYWNNNGDEHDS
jgi:hypothetical protein